MNGMGAGSRPWPNVGEQMDMNVLWELVNNIAEVHQGIREQTAGVLQRVQMIQARGGENGTGRVDVGGEGADGERVNGDGGGIGNGEFIFLTLPRNTRHIPGHQTFG